MSKNEEKFQKLLEETGTKYDQALRRLAGGEEPEEQAATLGEMEKRLIRGVRTNTSESLEEYEWMIDVTDYVKELLGDIVESAMLVDIQGGYTEEAMKEQFSEWMENFKRDFHASGSLNADQKAIRITFTNGRTAEFWNSEWGGINSEEKIEDRRKGWAYENSEDT